MSFWMEYMRWIELNVPDYEAAYGKCREVTEAMVQEFPDLERVRGHYYDAHIGEREHWWCVTKSGQVVDPTAKQFPDAGNGVYVPWNEGDPEPTGKCLECGEYCYDNKQFCCDNHEAAFRASLM